MMIRFASFLQCLSSEEVLHFLLNSSWSIWCDRCIHLSLLNCLWGNKLSSMTRSWSEHNGKRSINTIIFPSPGTYSYYSFKSRVIRVISYLYDNKILMTSFRIWGWPDCWFEVKHKQTIFSIIKIVLKMI